MTKISLCSTLFACLATFSVAGPLAAQTTASLVSSSYPTPIKSVGSTAFYSVSIQVAYPINLSPSSYISSTQLGNDVQGFNNAYPNAGDPPEAILSSILQAVLAKYPQMSGGTLEALTAGTAIAGVSIPDGGVVIVSIGKTSTLGGLFTGQSTKPVTSAVK